MQSFFQRSRIICYVLVGFMLLDCTPVWAVGGEEEPRLDIVRVEFSGTLVYIYYTLTGSANRTYQVSVSLKKRSDNSYQFTPINLVGDVGANVTPGENKIITWNASTEIPGGLKKDDYYFLLAVDVESGSGGWMSTPVLLAGGAAVIGGVVALFLLSPKAAEPAQPAGGFPSPPGRP